MGRNHSKACHLHPEFDFLYGCSRSAERRRDVEKTYGVATISDFRDLIGKVEAVVVATSTASHAQVALPLLQSGIHVLLEKPIASTVEEANQLVQCSNSSGALLQVGHIERFNPGWVAGCAWWLDQGLGAPDRVTCRRTGPWVDRPLDAGVVLDLMIHDVDLVLSLYGERRAVVTGAQSLGHKSGFDDLAVATLRFGGTAVFRDSDVRSQGVARFAASRVAEERIRLMRLEKGTTVLDIDFLNRSARYGFDLGRSELDKGVVSLATANVEFHDVSVKPQDQLAAQLTSFASAIRSGVPVVSGHDATGALATCLEILRVDQESLEQRTE